MSKTYTLTVQEAGMYDGDDERSDRLMRSLSRRFGEIAGGRAVTTEVRHPGGFVVEQYTDAPRNELPITRPC